MSRTLFKLFRHTAGSFIESRAEIETIMPKKTKYQLLSKNPSLLVSNHKSNFETAILPVNIYDKSSKQIRVVTRKGAVKGVARHALNLTTLLEINKNPTQIKSDINKIIEYLEKDTPVLMFPEGTRSRTGELKNYNPGLFQSAFLSDDVSIIPIDVSYTKIPDLKSLIGETSRDFDIKNSSSFFDNHGKILINYGLPINPKDFSDARSLSIHSRQKASDLVNISPTNIFSHAFLYGKYNNLFDNINFTTDKFISKTNNFIVYPSLQNIITHSAVDQNAPIKILKFYANQIKHYE